ncbi:ABC transporter permease [Brevibacterium casei]|uniref:ABC-type dipeptide/oligopeptide/nickel transport system, permease component n=1 Tax=Brevibacterium casei S18 TaxID=1229781 RepID=K9B4Q7_9MICO|nr:ABC transporter permease [Brevibacterium casei]EKU48770.1 ABC-type dipeptide/oligopeptide/nickel transport system, permease component [Brevibacterium casei S18]MBE4693435.1 ABC transporter permease [Brevibacterium casei]MBY3576558.1 ABC transporter permease [Brevibacterium casei]MCT1765198.1 ABC transporter permease [Brevibacterium casei]MCT2181473.1 ABC transporter permease [Brevibacterium casei]
MFAKVIIRRLIFSAFILLAVSLIVFGATLLLPGDAARAILGQQATPERIAALNEQLGLNLPAWQRYLEWLGGLFVGDFGTSTATGGPVSELLGERIGNSFILMALAAIISVPLGIGLGVYSALHRGTRRDQTLTGISLVLAAMPEFVIGIGLIAIFATSVFQILPAVTLAPPGQPVWLIPAQLVLPTATLVLVVTPYIVRMMRATMIEVLDSGFVEMARLKGVPERRVIFRHAVPHALGPVAQVVAIQLAWLAGGVVVVEFLFRYPGIGQALIDAVTYRDVQVVQAISMLVAAVYVVVNLAADIVGILTNPKLRSAA